MNYLNGFIKNLYENNLISIKEIDDFLEKRKTISKLAKKVCNSLGYKYQILDTFISNYYSEWIQKGYDNDTLVYIATFLYRHGYNSPDKMDEFIEKLHLGGHVSQSQVAYYFDQLGKQEKFIKKLLDIVGIVRRVTDRDSKQLQIWYDWGFENDVLEYAANLSVSKNSPFTYMNAILSAWKQQGLYTLQQVKSATPNTVANSNGVHFENERKYSKEELDKILINIDDFKF